MFVTNVTSQEEKMNKEIKNFNIDGIAIPYNTSIMIAGESLLVSMYLQQCLLSSS